MPATTPYITSRYFLCQRSPISETMTGPRNPPVKPRAAGGGFANALGRGFNVVGLFVVGVALAGSTFAQLSFVAASWLAAAIVIAVAGVFTTNVVLEDINKESKVPSKAAQSTGESEEKTRA